MSMVYLNDQTCGISKLNKLVIALENKKEFLHMYVIKSVFSFQKSNWKLKKKMFFFGGGGVIPLGYTGHDIVK